MAKLNLTPERLKALDPHDMLGKTLELPRQLLAGIELGRALVKKQPLSVPDAIEWHGLGGSAIAAEILQALGYEPPAIPVRITVQRFPRNTNTGAMRLVCSYSGDTIEAVKAFEDVKPSQIWLGMSSDGKIEKLARNSGVPHIKLPSGYPPRAALGFMLGAMIALCEEAMHCVVWEIPTAALEQDARTYRALNPEDNPALELAIKLVDRTPVIYTVDGVTMPAIAGRFRAQLAENAKVWSHMAQLPEMAHNEVESFPFLGQVLPTPLIILLGNWELKAPLIDPRPSLRSVMDTQSLAHVTIEPAAEWGREATRTELVLRTLLFLDTVSVYLAILRALDPSQIPVITKLKKAMTIT